MENDATAKTVTVVMNDESSLARARALAQAFGVSEAQVYQLVLEAGLRIGSAFAQVLGLDLPESSKELYTTGDLARMCGVTTQTIVDWARAGKVESLKSPGGHRRFTPSVVRAFLAKHGYTVPPELQGQ